MKDMKVSDFAEKIFGVDLNHFQKEVLDQTGTNIYARNKSRSPLIQIKKDLIILEYSTEEESKKAFEELKKIIGEKKC